LFAEVGERVRFITESGDDTLPGVDGSNVAERMRDPFAQQTRAHRGERAVNAADQRVTTVTTGAVEQFEVALRDGIERHVIADLIDGEPVDVARVPAERLLEVMQRCTSGANADGEVGGAESVERLGFEMVAQGKEGGLALKGPAVVRRERAICDLRFERLDLLGRDDDLGGMHASEFVGELLGVAKLGNFEIAGGQVNEREAEAAGVGAEGGKEVVAGGVEELAVEVRAGAEDLGDVAVDEFARLGFFELVADGDFTSVFEESADVVFGGVVRDAAHGDAVAGGEREVEKPGDGLGVVKKHLVEIAETEQQERVGRNLVFDAAVLLHHGREAVGLCRAGHVFMNYNEGSVRVTHENATGVQLTGII